LPGDRGRRLDGDPAGDAVDLHWQPSHTFVLDAAQDALAGVEDIADAG
jgi:spermidine/putrescine transport system ATP-binding protein